MIIKTHYGMSKKGSIFENLSIPLTVNQLGSPYVYVHIERAHLVDLSFQDTAILMKNGKKNEK